MLSLKSAFIRWVYRIKSLFGRSASAQMIRSGQLLPAPQSATPASTVTVKVDSGFRVPLSVLIAVVLTAALAIPVARWDAARKRDQWWVAEIKAKSGAVTLVLEAGAIEIDKADAEAIAAIDKENADARMWHEISKMLPQQPLSDHCNLCRIPAELRLRHADGRL